MCCHYGRSVIKLKRTSLEASKIAALNVFSYVTEDADSVEKLMQKEYEV